MDTNTELARAGDAARTETPDAERPDGGEGDGRENGAAPPSSSAREAARAAPPPASPSLEAADVLLVYDGECPACDNYCRVMRIREDVGRLVIVDAREDTPIMREITAAGLDIDDGMVLKLGEQLYYGSDAIHMLALIGSRSGVLNRLNYHLFRSPRVAHRLYPMLRAGRAVLLRLLGRTRINNLGLENNERF